MKGGITSSTHKERPMLDGAQGFLVIGAMLFVVALMFTKDRH